ncbi:MAG: redoxin domain-containing protein [Verrucomicrobia bacterium]|nr:redoxin domain-containing protein [Verrucomicrobiota bacterium]MDA1065737.1 redoxin domain-containing protein [Verrucomicrobiota bacterium]
MKTPILTILTAILASSLLAADNDKAPRLPIGSDTIPFNLPGIDGEMHTLEDYADSKLLVIAFTCNHCPSAQAYEERLNDLATRYSKEDVALVAISPNDDKAVRIDELGYTEYNDSLEEMILRAQEQDFKFPYLYDGENQETSWAYGAWVTTHILIFDENRKLRYNGRVDDNDNPAEVTSHDTRNAIDALLAGQPVPIEETKVFGCSVKWAAKRPMVSRSLAKWNQEEAVLGLLEPDQVQALVANDTENLRLINVWATWCGPCTIEFPELVDIHRQYRKREIEVISITMDLPNKQPAAQKFLSSQHASMTNYLFNSTDRFKLINHLDGNNWEGSLPYTMLVAPGGEVLYRVEGQFDTMTLKKKIVGYLGRTYFD